jgi:hypothetical protein
VLAACAAAMSVAGASAQNAEAPAEEPAFVRPKYQAQRFNEDWSVLRDKLADQPGKFFDPVKYIPLNDSGDIWVSFGGSARLRLEGWNNFNFGAPANAREHDDAFLLARMLFHSDLHIGPHLRVFLEGKSAHTIDRDLTGERRVTDTDDLDLQNGFIDLKLPIHDDAALTLRGGRQELLFGRQRLVSPLDWTNTRRTFDGVAGIADIGDWTATAFWGQLVQVDKYEFNEGDAQTQLFGIYANGVIPQTTIQTDLYWLGLQRGEDVTFNGTTGHERRHTLGGRLYGKVADTGFDYDLEGAWQTGDIGDDSIDAFMVASQFGYTFADVQATPRLFLGIDYASGDNAAGGDVETFNQLFPLAHAYLGYIDQIGRQNIIDLSTGLTVKPTQQLTLEVQGHLFWRADTSDALYNAGGAAYRAGGSGTSREVGAEIDLLAKYALNSHVDLLMGYSHFFAGAFIEQTGPSDDIDFVYASVEFRF